MPNKNTQTRALYHGNGGGKKKNSKKANNTGHAETERNSAQQQISIEIDGDHKKKKGKTEKKTDFQLINVYNGNRKLASQTNCKSICKIDYPYIAVYRERERESCIDSRVESLVREQHLSSSRND